MKRKRENNNRKTKNLKKRRRHVPVETAGLNEKSIKMRFFEKTQTRERGGVTVFSPAGKTAHIVSEKPQLQNCRGI
jgi:hypothetical protein